MNINRDILDFLEKNAYIKINWYPHNVYQPKQKARPTCLAFLLFVLTPLYSLFKICRNCAATHRVGGWVTDLGIGKIHCLFFSIYLNGHAIT